MDNAVLPTVVPIATVAKFLGLEDTHSYTENSVETLLRVIDEYDVPMYLLYEEIFGVRQEVVDEECYEDYETGNIQQLEPLEPFRFRRSDLYVKVENGRLGVSDDGASYLDISTFQVEGYDFRVTNQEGNLESTRYSLENFYFYRDDIINLKRHFSNNPETPKKTRKENFSAQHKRELAFKFWLITKAHEVTGSPDHLERDLQKCYEAIKSPTQENVWTALNKIDNRLFTSGRDDFFKRQKLVEFKKGTGAKR